MVADFLCEIEDLLMQLRHGRNRRTDDVPEEMLAAMREKPMQSTTPIHIATSGKCIKENAVDVLDRWLQMTLDHTMELEGLAGCNFECATTVLIGNLVHL